MKTIKITVILKATPTDVFSALTDAKKIAQWGGGKGKLKPGLAGSSNCLMGG